MNKTRVKCLLNVSPTCCFAGPMIETFFLPKQFVWFIRVRTDGWSHLWSLPVLQCVRAAAILHRLLFWPTCFVPCELLNWTCSESCYNRRFRYSTAIILLSAFRTIYYKSLSNNKFVSNVELPVMMMVSGATAQTGPWPPLRVSWQFYSTMWGYQLHDRPVLDTLIQPSETSSSHYQRLSWRSRETRVRNGRWILPTSTYRARRVLLHAVNLRHGTDGRRATDFITREPWVQWQAR
jgi:hypothetical protein